MEEKFYDLAFKKLSGRASGEELRELDELLTQDSELQGKYDQLARELPIVKELSPLLEEPGDSSDELPEFEKSRLMDEVVMGTSYRSRMVLSRSRPASMPGPRGLVRLVRLALSKLPLKIHGTLSSPQTA